MRKKVTVRVACTTGPLLVPVVPSRPLGTSTATIGLAQALIAATTSAAMPSSGRDRPAPNRASMTTSAPAIVAGLNGSTAAPQRVAISAASPLRASRDPSRPRRTPSPRSRRSLAATKPSPPLLPGPQTTAMAAPARPASSAAASATARPAFSISASPGTPCCAASASARAISAAVNSSWLAKGPPSIRGGDLVLGASCSAARLTPTPGHASTPDGANSRIERHNFGQQPNYSAVLRLAPRARCPVDTQKCFVARRFVAA